MPPADESEGQFGLQEGEQADQEVGQDRDYDGRGGDSEDRGEECRNGPNGEDEIGPHISGTLVVVSGRFFLERGLPEYFLARPSEEDLIGNPDRRRRLRALWKWAIGYTILTVVRRQILTWTGLKERRKQRLQFIELARFKERFVLDSARAPKWEELVKRIHPYDLHLWRCIAMFQDQRDPIHM